MGSVHDLQKGILQGVESQRLNGNVHQVQESKRSHFARKLEWNSTSEVDKELSFVY